MSKFVLKPEIRLYDQFKDFAEEFDLGTGDFIFTSPSIYEMFMKDLNLDATIVYRRDYGSGEPTDVMINKIIADMPKTGIKRVVAIGGGSVLDIAKLLIFKDVDDVLDLFDKKVPFVKDKELIMVPTSCGTGSEVTNISIAELTTRGTKMGLADNALLPDYAVLIPETVKGLPFEYFVTSSIDALVHAMEAYLSPKANVFTDLYGEKAIDMLIQGFKEIVEKGPKHSLNLLEEFLIASNFAGIAFGNAGCAAVHAMSYPLGGIYHVPHGEANYTMLTEVFKLYNERKPEGKIAKINDILARHLNTSGDKVYDELEVLLNQLLPKKPLKEHGMKEEDIIAFTDIVVEKQQRLLGNNYVPLERDDFINIYTALF